jgi:hypothetical protein
MATRWYFKQKQQEHGPISFHELVVLVKDGILSEDDLVRPEYQRTWQTADTAVGLFNMARRVPREQLRLGPSEKEATASVSEPIGAGDACSDESEASDLQQWFQEQLAATPLSGTVGDDLVGQAAGLKPSGDPGDFDPPTTPQRGLWQSVVAAAVARIDARHDDHAAGKHRWWHVRGWWIASCARANRTLRFAYRCGMSIGVASLTWSLLQQAHITEAMRFPGWQQETGTMVFPLLPGLSPAEYTFLAWDLAVVMAVVGYAAATWIERHVEDV